MKVFLRKIGIIDALLIGLLCLFIPLISVMAINTGATGYRIIAGNRVNNGNALIQLGFSSPFRAQHLITNNRSEDIFVPTKTVSEWDTFLTNLPTNVTTSPLSSGGGTAPGGGK